MTDIKLIIWDLDDTLWQGTLAENEDILLKVEVVDRIKFLLDRGIVHSICSKNNAEKAQKVLHQLGIDDLFIFPKISFENKGRMIQEIIRQTQLRAQNVLFVDDNEFVLREAVFQNPNLNIQIIDQFMQDDVSHWGKLDNTRERLAQYKILEKKDKNKSLFLKHTANEQAFLKECNITIQMIPLTINDPDIERIIDLINRSNQLNFTQSRIPYEYLFTLFELKNGINFKIRVEDNYGNYGIVGYVCIINNTLFHYVFSCRILGMCVETRVYQWLKKNYPELHVKFNPSHLKDIDANLDFMNISLQQDNKNKANGNDVKILVRGPCLANAISFLLNEQYQVDEEIFSFFEYTNLAFLKANINNKQDPRFKKTFKAINTNEYPIIVNFLESDYYSGFYKIQSQLIPITSNYIYWKSVKEIKKDNQLLDEHIKALMLNGMSEIKKFNLENKFSPWPRMEKIANLSLEWFGMYWRKFLYHLFFYTIFKNYQGYLSKKQFKQNLEWYIAMFPKKVTLIFINPPEKIILPFMNEKQKNKITHRTKILNGIMRDLANENSNVLLIEMDEFLEQEDIIDNFSHLKRQGYIKLSQSLFKTVNDSLSK